MWGEWYVVGLKHKDHTFVYNAGFSPDSKFPQAEFSPYGNRTYEWNPSVRPSHKVGGLIFDMYLFLCC